MSRPVEVVAKELQREFVSYTANDGQLTVEQRSRRVEELKGFLGHDSVADAPLPVRVAFLALKGYATSELEDALSQLGHLRDYEALLSGAVGAAAMDDLGTSDMAASRKPAAARRASASALEDDSDLEDESNIVAPTGTVHVAEGFWREGATVFAFKGDMTYYPCPLLGFDTSRNGDVIAISHQLPNGEYGDRQFLPPGFKGVVPDEFPLYNAVHQGDTVLVRQGTDPQRSPMVEAVVLAKHSPSSGGDGEEFALNLERSVDGARFDNIPHSEVRTLLHPRLLLRHRSVLERRKRKAQGANERINSGGSFLCTFESWPAEDRRSLGDGEDRLLLTAALRNFLRFPDLDTFEQPGECRTGDEFALLFGETDLGVGGFPVHPESQRTGSGVGFRFDLRSVPRHPRSRLHCAHNPILYLAQQCLATGCMFSDPDFPPSDYSVWGRVPPAPTYGIYIDNDDGRRKWREPENYLTAPRGSVVWRRLSEIHFRPRLRLLGSNGGDIRPGPFSPKWLPALFAGLQFTSEVEDIISPGEDGWVYGAYVVRLFIDGRWTFVVVDDFVPCSAATGQPLTCTSGSGNEIYCALIEKALAKTNGSYAALQRTTDQSLARAWEDTTSNICEVVSHDAFQNRRDLCSNLCDIVVEEYTSCSVQARVRDVLANPRQYDNTGFVPGQFWTVDSSHEYYPSSRREDPPMFLFHVVRGPHAGCDVPNINVKRDTFLQGISSDVLEQLPSVANEAVTYWLQAQDFFNLFDTSYCLRMLNNFQKATVPGTFAGRPLAAGKLLGFDRLLRNPQILLSFVQPTECVMHLTLSDRRLAGGKEPQLPAAIDGTGLQLHLFKGPPIEHPLPPDPEPGIIASSSLIDVADDDEMRAYPSVYLRLELPGGNYIVTPSLGRHSSERFTLRVFSVAAFYAKLVN